MTATVTLRDRQPEECLLERGDARGVTVRLHSLGSFRIVCLAVQQRGPQVTVVRRELQVGPRGVVTPAGHESFRCPRSYLEKVSRDLVRLGIREAESFCAKDVLDGELLNCQFRDDAGVYRQVSWFCWQYAEDAAVVRLGDYLQRLALLSRRNLSWRAFVSRFW